jgi:perosamine synthetase
MLLPSFRQNKSFYSLSGNAVQHLFWARNAIYHGLSALGLNPGDNVLVPAFHCTSVVEPILQYGAEVKFYDINLDVSPDLEDLRSKIDRKTRAILAIHYFGFPQPIQKFRELCRAHKLYLIEDCAHVLTERTRD